MNKAAARLAELMDGTLQRVTGLNALARKRVIYYTLATHALGSLETFPLLVLKGPMGTGSILAECVHRPSRFSLRGRTLPVIRDELVKCHDGTAIIEEADQAWRDSSSFESMLSDRYKRATAEIARKESNGKEGWVTKDALCFGATVLHRRLPFADAALNGRSVFVYFRTRHDRTYDSLAKIADASGRLPSLLTDLAGLTLPAISAFPGVAARTFDTYRPLLAIAQICDDSDFIKQMDGRLRLETDQLKEAQSLEPDGIVLRALIQRLTERKDALDFSRNIRVGDIADGVWNNERVTLKPQQVAGILRDLGFETKNSHGVTTVVPKPATLVRACEECGYEDSSIAALREELLSGREGREGGPFPACGERDEGGPAQVPVIHLEPPHAGESLPSLPGLPESLAPTTERQELGEMTQKELAKLRAKHPYINEKGFVNLGDPRFYGLKSWDDIPSLIRAAKRRRPK
jgi:hypothetical protein